MRTVLCPDDPFVVALKEKILTDLRECWSNTDRQPFIAVSDLDAAGMVAGMRGLRIEKLPDEKNHDKGFVFEKVKPIGQPECWVSVDDNVKYRSLYHKFLRKYYGLPRHAFLDSSSHVDHIFSRKNARRTQGMGYVRVTLARGDVNSTFGRYWERHDERNERASSSWSVDEAGSPNETGRDAAPNPTSSLESVSPGRRGAARCINWPMATKAFGIPAPSGAVTTSYVLGTLRKMVNVGLLGPGNLQDKFGLYAAVFRMGMAGLSHEEAQQRARARAITTDEVILTEWNSLAEWLAASIRETD